MNQAAVRLKVYIRYDEWGTSLLERKRILAGFSTLGLAREAGVSRSSVWRLEGNHQSQAVRPDIASKIVLALRRRLESLGEGSCNFDDIFELKSNS